MRRDSVRTECQLYCARSNKCGGEHGELIGVRIDNVAAGSHGFLLDD